MNINIIEDQMLVDLNENSTLVEWYNDYAKVKIIASNLSDGTKQKYDAFSNVIVKYFGDKPITAISPRDYQVIFNKLGKNVGRDYAQRINKLIEKVAQYAKDEGIPVKDFTKSLDIFEKRSKKDRDEKYLHSRKDFNTVLEACKLGFNYDKSVVAYYVYLLFQTAFRPSELLALKWKHVDFLNGRIKTEERINTVTMERTGPKNKSSIRTIPFNEETKVVLQELRSLQQNMLKQHCMINPEDLVFQHWAYEPMLPSNSACTKFLHKILEEHKIKPKISLYGARHTKLSILVSENIELDVVAKYAGHSSTEQIIKTYGGLLKENEIVGFDLIAQV